MANVLSLGGGAALLLGHVLIGLKVRWPAADTPKVAVAGAVMAGIGSLVAAKITPALLAVVATGVSMAACFSLSAIALDIVGIRGMVMRAVVRRGATPKPFFALHAPLGREGTGST